MAKAGGLGDRLFIHGYDFSGDIGSLQRVAGGPALLVQTGIDKSAIERIGGIRSGEISFMSHFNDVPGQAHPVLRARPITDRFMSYLRGTALGGQAACLPAKQINYDGNRTQDGGITFTTQGLSNGGLGLEWYESLTAGKVTHASATNGSSVDYGAVSTAFGATALWHVFDIGSGTVDGEIQDSANDSSFAAVTGLAFTAIADGAEPAAERVVTSPTATIRRYVRFASTDVFTDAVLWAGFVRHLSLSL